MASDELRLDDELRSLGRLLEGPGDPAHRVDVDALAAAVMERLARQEGPALQERPAAGGWRRVLEAVRLRRRRILLAVALVLLSLAGAPAVRAAVAEFLGFDGVRVEIRPGPAPAVTPTTPRVTGDASLQQAARLVGFRPVVIPALGPPDGVEVSADRRILSMSWQTGRGTVRLDEFDGRLDYTFAKSAAGVEFLTVGSSTALWFDAPHDVVVLDAAGNPRTETARLAGHTLIWEGAGTVLRLEGDVSKQRALELASSARPFD